MVYDLVGITSNWGKKIMDNGIRYVILSFIGILPSHNLIELEYQI